MKGPDKYQSRRKNNTTNGLIKFFSCISFVIVIQPMNTLPTLFYFTMKLLRNEKIFNHKFYSSKSQNLVNNQNVNSLNIFDRNAKKLQRERAALAEKPEVFDYLKEEIGYRLADRIYDIKRKFKKVIDLGCSRGYVSKHVTGDSVEELIMTDQSELLMSHCICDDSSVKTSKIVCDAEQLGDTFQPESADLVISNLALHWVNKLPTCFGEVLKILKIDGVFLGSMFGMETLYELRSSLQLAEIERKGGFSPHISPFAKPVDVGHLLASAGFVMQTIDTDEIIVRYPTMFDLLEDLKGMGESNAAWNRSLHLSRDTLLAAAAIYEHYYANSKKDDADDNLEGIPATFQILYFIGWKPDPSKPQAQPKQPTMISLRDYYKIHELSKEDPKKIPVED